MWTQDITIPGRFGALATTVRLPDQGQEAPYPVVVQGPGWMGLRDARLYLPYHKALTDAGIAVVIIDYRGFAESEGNAESITVSGQLEDLVDTVDWVERSPQFDGDRIGVFGSGGTGGGNAISLAAHDTRIRCVVSQVPIADGEAWLRGMRNAKQWEAFLDRLARDRVGRARGETGDRVNPRTEITVPTQERKTTTMKSDVDSRVPNKVSLHLADDLLDYRPLDVVGDISPRGLMIVAVDHDNVTPTQQAISLFESAGPPKRLILQRGTTHYAAYERYGEQVRPRIVGWFRECLGLDGRDEPDLTGEVELVGTEESER